jgi:hypothetical protein
MATSPGPAPAPPTGPGSGPNGSNGDAPADGQSPSCPNKKYADCRRPRYKKGQVEKVWEDAKDEDGNVYDPNTGGLLTWDPSKSRQGQWDMGHKPGKEFRKTKKDYMDGKISEQEFVDECKNPANYQPEDCSANRSHRYEAA